MQVLQIRNLSLPRDDKCHHGTHWPERNIKYSSTDWLLTSACVRVTHCSCPSCEPLLFKFSYRKAGFRLSTLMHKFLFLCAQIDMRLVKSKFIPAEKSFHGPFKVCSHGGRFPRLRCVNDRLRRKSPGHPCFEWIVVAASRTNFVRDIWNTNVPVSRRVRKEIVSKCLCVNRL